MPARADASRASSPTPSAASGPSADLDGEPDDPPRPTAEDRLRALLTAPDPWRDRLADRVVGAALALRSGVSPGRVVAVVVLAVVLGVGAFVALRAAGAAPVDPVQVLPRADGGDPPGAGPALVDRAEPASSTAPTPSGSSEAPPGSARTTVAAHAAGAVVAPGVYRVDGEARVADLIAAAGGLAPDADPDRINLAAPVHDGERVYVPRRGEGPAPEVVAGRPGPEPGGGTSAPGDGRSDPGGSPAGPAAKVDLNTADAAALDALPGIGPATAAAIIGHRAEHGPFSTVDELQDVAGIGPAKLAQLRDLVTV